MIRIGLLDGGIRIGFSCMSWYTYMCAIRRQNPGAGFGYGVSGSGSREWDG